MYKVFEMCFDEEIEDEDNENCDGHKHHYFATKKLAVKFIQKEIVRREKINTPEEEPDRDIFGDSMERRLTNLYKKKKWLELARYYSLYLYEIKVAEK